MGFNFVTIHSTIIIKQRKTQIENKQKLECLNAIKSKSSASYQL